jgi:histidinol dehydrogenase
MLLRLLEPSRPDHARAVAAVCDRSASASAELDGAVREIIGAVRSRGDAAVGELTLRFDGRSPEPARGYEIPRERWRHAADAIEPGLRAALRHAALRIRRFHAEQIESPYQLDEPGISLSLRVDPLDRVGLYVPGGTARYPSSVLMNAIPARVAGVREIIMVTPGASDATLAAAELAGVDRVFEIGGAQAIAALAYGTETVPRVDKIVGPGNQWVAAAKRLVYGDVDIDAVAGPSEVLIVADGSAEPRFVAADLLAQAEHDVEAHPVLITTDRALVGRVDAELARQLADLPRAAIAGEALARHGVAIVVADLDAAVALANRFAAEHVELQLADADAVAARITTAGAIFVGAFTPEAAGDYVAGPNHVLPTGGAARYASPLGVYDFRKRTSVLRYTRDGLRAQVDDIVRIAASEGLTAHARSAAIRVAGEEGADER